MSNTIYTHDEALIIVEAFENVLDRYDIHVPSPEDDEREPDNMAGLYGTTYSDLLDEVEIILCNMLTRCKRGDKIVNFVFSGTV